MRCENKPLLQDDPRFFQDITSTAVEVGLARTASTSTKAPSASPAHPPAAVLNHSLRVTPVRVFDDSPAVVPICLFIPRSSPFGSKACSMPHHTLHLSNEISSLAAMSSKNNHVVRKRLSPRQRSIGNPAGIGLEQRLLFGIPVTIHIPFAKRLALRQQVQQEASASVHFGPLGKSLGDFRRSSAYFP